MTDMAIPPEAVEAAALDLYRQERNHEPWLAHSEGVRERYRASARELLEAALPHLRPLFETATKVALELGRKEAAEEIAAALEAVPGEVYPEDVFPPDGTSIDCQSARVMRFAYPAAATLAREISERETS